jgi:ketosteroid isomerase-like protein
MSEESTTPDLVELVRRFNDAWNRRDVDAFLSLVAANVVYSRRSPVRSRLAPLGKAPANGLVCLTGRVTGDGHSRSCQYAAGVSASAPGDF